MTAQQPELQAIQHRLQALKTSQRPDPVEATPSAPGFSPSFSLSPASPSHQRPIQESQWPASEGASMGTTQELAFPDLPPGSSNSQAPSPQASSPDWPQKPSQKTLAETVAVLKERSTDPFAPLAQPYGQNQPGGALEQQVAESFQRLEAQAAQVNRLAAEQEQALRELRAIADQVESTWKAAEGSQMVPGYCLPTICEYTVALVPCVTWEEDGSLMLTSREIDLFQPEHDAARMAQALRRRTRQRTWTAGLRAWRSMLTKLRTWVMGQSDGKRSRTARPTRTAYANPNLPDFSPTDLVIWVAGAAIARVGFDLAVAAFPALGTLTAGLMALGVAFAIYRVAVAPRSSLVLGYYLFLILIGLLIGGRLP